MLLWHRTATPSQTSSEAGEQNDPGSWSCKSELIFLPKANLANTACPTGSGRNKTSLVHCGTLLEHFQAQFLYLGVGKNRMQL
uniref:Uncharacterized protein n=1 Tax=Salvator merianae TaxID=96440 RepID=A0A8D0BRT9_SALMN